MANINRCDGCGRRNGNSNYGCLNCLAPKRCWEGPPCWENTATCWDGGLVERSGETAERGVNRPERGCFGLFTAMLPMAVAPNGVIPLVNNCWLGNSGGFNVNCGLVTIEEAGTYLATYTVRLPEEQEVKSTITLNVNDASQASAVTQVGGAGPVSFTAQAIFDVCDRATLTLRSSEAINVPDTSTQPMVTLSLVRI